MVWTLFTFHPSHYVWGGPLLWQLPWPLRTLLRRLVAGNQRYSFSMSSYRMRLVNLRPRLLPIPLYLRCLTSKASTILPTILCTPCIHRYLCLHQCSQRYAKVLVCLHLLQHAYHVVALLWVVVCLLAR